LQAAFDVPIVIQITDDEKYIYRPELELESTIKMGISNIKDIIAFGFDPEKTFIFSDVEYI
jgi:tryptophanyl-tRNA synthetase